MNKPVPRKADIISSSPQMVISQGIIQNLPEILGAVKEIYALHKKDKAFHSLLQSRLDEMNINKENFKVLVQSLTDLSKTENADIETKTMYRDMIKMLFEFFTSNMHSSQDISNYLDRF